MSNSNKGQGAEGKWDKHTTLKNFSSKADFLKFHRQKAKKKIKINEQKKMLPAVCLLT